MPELPEVETAVILLKEKVLSETFDFVWAENKKKEEQLSKLKGKKIKDVQREGKGIFLFLDDESILFIHLRMTGHLLLGKWERKENEWYSKEKIMQDPKNGFLRVIFFFKSGKQLALSDPRKFAVCLLISKKELEEYVKKLGPDALSVEKEELESILKKRKRKIKPLLMDQGVLAGIGNIYAAEILFKAKIRPDKLVNLLSKEEVKRIYKEMRKVLKKGIKLKGDSTSDYRLLSGEKGGYQKEHLVYKREKESCFVCKGKIKRVNLGGRGTYYCPRCQK